MNFSKDMEGLNKTRPKLIYDNFTLPIDRKICIYPHLKCILMLTCIVWEECGLREALNPAGGNINWCNYCGLPNTKMNIAFKLVPPLKGVYCKVCTCGSGYMCLNDCDRFVHNERAKPYRKAHPLLSEYIVVNIVQSQSNMDEC